MNDLFKLHEYSDGWEYEVKKKLSNYTIKKHEIVNILINIVFAFFCIFVFKLKFWMLPIAFIICDLLLMPFNVLFVRVLPEKIKNLNNISSLTKRNEQLAKMIAKQRRKLDKGHTVFERSVIRNDIDWMEEEMLSNEKKIKKMQKEAEKSPVTTYEKIQKTNKEKIIETIEKIGSFDLTEDMKNHEINLATVYEKSKKIISILEEKPQGIEASYTTFNLYGKELIEVLENIKNMHYEERISYYPRVKEIITEYELHIDRLIERIKREDYIKTNVDLNVLFNEITKDKKEGE